MSNSRHHLMMSAALGCVLAGGALRGACAQSTGFVATATQGVPVSALLGATDLGAVPRSQAVTLRLGLQMQNASALKQLVAAQANPASPSYGQFLTPAQFVQGFAPGTAQVDSVVAFLKGAGFHHVVVEQDGLLVSADGNAAQAEAAFNTKLEQVLVGGKPLFVNTLPAQVPAALGGLVTAVLGLNTVGHMSAPLALPSPPQYLVSYNPTQFQVIYNANTVKPATRASIAIMAEGDLTGVLTDLRTEETAFGLPQVKVIVRPVGVASTDVSGADEWDLDTQYSSGMAQSLRVLYAYDTTSLSDSDTALEFARWASDDRAKGGSASFGECEIFPYIDGAMTVDDQIFLEAAAQGQTMFASAGDTGSFCPVGPAGVNGVPLGAPLVNYPAASPYVVGVGGTTLLTNADGSYDTEVAWNTGGGGISQFETAPSWQEAAVSVLSTTGTRGVPDVAMDADPNSGATVYVGGAPETVGGTSLSSPLALGVFARVVSINPKLGFAAPRYYGLYNPTGGTGGVLPSYPKGGFHDIIVGNNGLYVSGPGYDLITGLGTFIVSQLTADLAK